MKEYLKKVLKRIPILGNIWHYRNLGLEYDKLYNIENQDVTSPDYIQHKRYKVWANDNGDMLLNLSCDVLEPDSIVIDLGGYEGQWTSDIFSKYLCNIYIFEPYKKYSNNIKKRFAKNKKIKVFDFGLANETFVAKLSLSDNGSSMFIVDAKDFVEIQLVKAIVFFHEEKITQVDLLKINIEGGEYDLLEHLIESGFVGHIKNIKVQFHDFIIENAKERMTKIQQNLTITHKLVYQYEFMWEHWELK